MRKLLPFLISCGIAGCAGAPQAPTPAMTNANDDHAMMTAMLPGTSTIKGQASARTASGEVRNGAGVTISLLPMTPYVATCLKGHTFTDSPCASKLANYRMQTPADGDGRFVFLKLKPGTYYLEATMPWGVPSQPGGASAGGTFSTQATIKTDDQEVVADIH